MMYLTLYNYFTFLFLFFRVSLYSELVNYELYLKKTTPREDIRILKPLIS